MPVLSLTRRQTEILAHIRDYQDAHGYPPTRAEIAQRFHFRSANAAEQHLRALARKGAIELIPGTSRGLRLIGGAEGLPIVGRVAAGDPILAAEHLEGHYAIDPGLFRPAADYLLRIQGESMRDAGILDGDLLAVRKADTAADGNIVVARIDDEVTVKRLRSAGHPRQLLLVPENPDFSPIEVNLEKHSFAIEGVSVGLIRRMT